VSTTSDDEQARRKRAKRLREQIEDLKSGQEPGDKEPSEGEESPRDFVERKMRDEGEKEGGA
jgi:hypothetical protein